MGKGTKKVSLIERISHLDFLPNRKPEMAFSGGAEKAFAEISEYRDGAIYVGHYTGESEWERHSRGDEIVLVLEGETTLVLLSDGQERSTRLIANELFVVPENTWHRFKGSRQLKVMTVTPQPTDHSLETPRA